MMSLYSVFLLSSKAWEGTGFLECDFYPAIHDDLWNPWQDVIYLALSFIP